MTLAEGLVEVKSIIYMAEKTLNMRSIPGGRLAPFLLLTQWPLGPNHGSGFFFRILDAVELNDSALLVHWS